MTQNKEANNTITRRQFLRLAIPELDYGLEALQQGTLTPELPHETEIGLALRAALLLAACGVGREKSDETKAQSAGPNGLKELENRGATITLGMNTHMSANPAEIENLDLTITPSIEEYEKTIDILADLLKKEQFRGFTKLKQLARIEYYNLVKNIFKRKTQVIPCYAAINECQISPTGEVWNCSLMGRSMGDLRQENYNLKRIWSSQKAEQIRKSIKNKECWCPVANIAYTNMICNPKISLKMIYRFLFL